MTNNYANLLTPKNIELAEQLIAFKQQYANFIEAEKTGTLSAEQLIQRENIVAEIEKLTSAIEAMTP
jgi:hypothetical protein